MRNQLLRDADWASMAHSLELRTPFVDWHLLQHLAPLLASSKAPGKSELARLPLKPLPAAVLSRQKTGFSVPVREWLLAARGPRKRGLRQWARHVYKSAGNTRRALALVSDGFGGRGGIAKFNRDLLGAIASDTGYREIVAIPRLQGNPTDEPLPPKLHWDTDGLGGKTRYAWHFIRRIFWDRHYDLVVCGHINLLPVAWLASRLLRAPLILIVHGIEAWQPTGRRFVDRLVGKVDFVIAVSSVTKQRFLEWSHLSEATVFVLPNSIDMSRFHPKEKNSSLMRKHGLDHEKKILMTLGRVSGRERYKGFDEVLEVLPDLIQEFPELIYFIAGGGDDLERLRKKAATLGAGKHVVFAGQVSENEKVDYYNLADAFLLPSRGEGFGIVLLEAMACGLPALASRLDGSREALRDGELGVLVDPRNPEELKQGIRKILSRPKTVPQGLEYFSFSRYQDRAHHILDRIAYNPSA
jgi:glycosyltransferase involved in cell wall biosynthesis